MDADTEELSLWLPRVQDRSVAPGHHPMSPPIGNWRPAGQCRDRTARLRPGLASRSRTSTMRSTCVLAAPDFDRFHPAQPVSRDPLRSDPQFQQDPANIIAFFRRGTAQGRSSGATQVPLAAVARLRNPTRRCPSITNLQYPAATVTWNSPPNPAPRQPPTPHAGDGRDAFAGYATHRFCRRNMKVLRESPAVAGIADPGGARAVYIRARRALRGLAIRSRSSRPCPSAGLGALRR